MKFYFEYPIEGSYQVSNKVSVNRSQTEDSIHKIPMDNKSTTKNGSVSSTANNNAMRIGQPQGSLMKLGLTDNTDGTYTKHNDIRNRGTPPPTSISVPEFNKHTDKHNNYLDVERRNKGSKSGRPGPVSPGGDRKGNFLLPHTDSEGSMVGSDAVSVGESDPEDLSDTDTEDEWAGCETTAV